MPINPAREIAIRPDRSGEPFRLLLIDPRPVTRSYLADRLRMALEGSVTDIGDAREVHGLAACGGCFDAVVFNLGDDAFDAARLNGMIAPVRSHFPDCAVLLLSSRTERASILAALCEGVQAYLPTDRRLDAILDAIRFVCSGWVIYPAAVLIDLRSIFSDLPGVPATATADTGVEPGELTPRQTEVLRCLAAGMTNRGVASHLHISQSTVKAHVKAIMLRVRAVNRTQAVALLRSKQSRDRERNGVNGASSAIEARP